MPLKGYSSTIIVPMDDTQKNHLKAYGVAYWVLQNDVEIDWLLNYRGGSFMIKHIKAIEEELIISARSPNISWKSKDK